MTQPITVSETARKVLAQHGLDATDLDMIAAGDFLGPAGVKAFNALVSTADELSAALEEIERLKGALANIAKEAAFANNVIAHNRDGAGQGRVKVATSMHRIAEITSALNPTGDDNG